MRIGELASASGVSVRSLRYYEDQGLLAAGRSSTGQRTYDTDAVGRVILIQQLFSAGLCSKTMAELLPCISDPNLRTTELHSKLLRERARLDSEIEKVIRNRDSLENIIQGLGGGGA